MRRGDSGTSATSRRVISRLEASHRRALGVRRSAGTCPRRATPSVSYDRPVSEPRPPPVAPFDACVSCSKGDTTTAFGLVGTAELISAGLMRCAGIPSERAAEMAIAAFRQLGSVSDTGWPRGMRRVAFRLCRECAKRYRAEVGELPTVGDLENTIPIHYPHPIIKDLGEG